MSTLSEWCEMESLLEKLIEKNQTDESIAAIKADIYDFISCRELGIRMHEFDRGVKVGQEL